MASPARTRSHVFLIASALGIAILVGLVFTLGSLNVPFLQPAEAEHTILLYSLSTFIVLSLLIFGLVLSRSLLKLYAERRRAQLGSKFKTKMVIGALGLSLLPATFLFLFSYALLNRTLAKWFPRPLEIVRDNAQVIVDTWRRSAEESELEHARLLASDPELIRALQRRDSAGLELAMSRGANHLGLDWVAALDPNGKLVYTHRARELVGDFASVVDRHHKAAGKQSSTVLEQDGKHFLLVHIPVHGLTGATIGSLAVVDEMPEEIWQRAAQIQNESQKYAALSREQKTYRWQALSILLLITCLILFAATWFALFLAKMVTVPVQALAEATHEVARGNMDHRVQCQARDELGTLVESFNQMTAQLAASSRQIEESNRSLQQAIRELEARRQWMEAILESIPTGVISLDQNRRVTKVNSAIAKLVGKEAAHKAERLEDLFGSEEMAAFNRLLRRAIRLGTVSSELELRLANRIAHIAVTVAALRDHQEHSGFVIVLEDLTELLQAQKAAAWQEVAQRIAHEIKNPLTPIQLSAERIRRYLERHPQAVDTAGSAELGSLIAECATLIGNEVHTLKNLVDEFSHFARFPAAQPTPSNLNAIITSALSLFNGRLDGIRIRTELATDLPTINVDPELMRRVLINLIDNAAEAMEGSSLKELSISTRFDRRRERVEIAVADTGHGIAPEDRDKLFLPYFSTKGRGTGLGLAIASRIVAEHNGTMRAEANSPVGARFIIELPVRESA